MDGKHHLSLTPDIYVARLGLLGIPPLRGCLVWRGRKSGPGSMGFHGILTLNDTDLPSGKLT